MSWGGISARFAGDFQDFYLFCLPLARRILVRRNPYFLSGAKAFSVTFVPLACGDVLSEENHGVGHFHAAQHIVLALNKNPAGRNRGASRRINDFA